MDPLGRAERNSGLGGAGSDGASTDTASTDTAATSGAGEPTTTVEEEPPRKSPKTETSAVGVDAPPRTGSPPPGEPGEPTTQPDQPQPPVVLRVIYNKEVIPVTICLSSTIAHLKTLISTTTTVAPELLKVLVKGAKDELTLSSLGLTQGSKIIVIGTRLEEVLDQAKRPEVVVAATANESEKESDWSTTPRHLKVLEKGPPDDVMAGISGVQERLPPFPLFGMLSSRGAKVRLTFKLEVDELWIGTKERTEKIPMGTIRSVATQPIAGHEHYSILAVQIGPTEASRVWIYWVPSQYVNAIKQNLRNY